MPPSPCADRNLLFGILALQMDFVSRDALIAAMNAWVLDKAKSLGAILQGQGLQFILRVHALPYATAAAECILVVAYSAALLTGFRALRPNPGASAARRRG